jgi:hypothetical protein
MLHDESYSRNTWSTLILIFVFLSQLTVCFKIWFNPPFLFKCLYQVRFITVFTVFRLLTDFVCLYTYELWFSLCKIVRSWVILLLPLFNGYTIALFIFMLLFIFVFLFKKERIYPDFNYLILSLLNYEKKVMVSNFININKAKNHLLLLDTKETTIFDDGNQDSFKQLDHQREHRLI